MGGPWSDGDEPTVSVSAHCGWSEAIQFASSNDVFCFIEVVYKKHRSREAPLQAAIVRLTELVDEGRWWEAQVLADEPHH